MIIVKTKNYDARYTYPVNAYVYIKDKQFSVKPINCRQKPFGYVVYSPIGRRKELTVEIIV